MSTSEYLAVPRSTSERSRGRGMLVLVTAIVAFFVTAIVWVVSDRRAAQRIYDDYSIANTSDSGLSLAAGYLRRQRKVAMLTSRLGRAPIERDAVVFRVAETLPIYFDPEEVDEKRAGPPNPRRTPLISEDAESWVRGGGRLVVAVREGVLTTSPLGDETVQKVFPIWPAVGALHIAGCDVCTPVLGLTTLRPRMHALFASASHVVVARERIGEGELFVLSAPELLRNDWIGDENHLALLEALAGERSRPVYFDETLHGMVAGDGALALMKEWNLGPFLLLASAATILFFWRNARRVGPPEDDHRETRSDAVDLVRSLGALYGKRTSDAEAIALYHDALTRTVALSTGLRGDALRERVDELTGGLAPPRRPGNLPAALFRRLLMQVNQGFERLAKRNAAVSAAGPAASRRRGGRGRGTPAGQPAGRQRSKSAR